MPEPIQDLVKKQAVNIKTHMSMGLKEDQIPEEFKQKGVRKELQGFPEYKHKSSMYEGLSRDTTKNHGQYIKFRRVSDKSSTSKEGESWIHPGFQAKNYMNKALDGINESFERAINEFLRQKDLM